MVLFFLLFCLIFSATYNYVESSYSDAFMKKGDCEKASIGYYNDFTKTKNPLVASNYALSLICLNKNEEAEIVLDFAFNKIDSVEDINRREEIKLNYVYIKSLNFKFDESNKVLRTINELSLANQAKSLYFALLCRNNTFLNNYYTALNFCIATYNTDKDSCFKAGLLAKLYYHLERYQDAVKLYEKIFDKCVGEDISYYYSYSLYSLGKKDLALKILKNSKNQRNKDLFDVLNKN